jgi:hypothetical protein
VANAQVEVVSFHARLERCVFRSTAARQRGPGRRRPGHSSAADAPREEAPPVEPPAPPSQASPDTAPAPRAKDYFALPEALAMIESVCERDLVAQPWTEDADHRALFTMCQALAVAHDEEARRQNT